ncbi:MAG: HNH endonuclease [Deltaproteobacteria bacterium]|nr:HNH endonuclease [Deltaproteobacteria bacterium]
MIGRVADAETVAAWVARAAERTVKHLREEIDAAGLVARVSGVRGPLAPPDEATVAAVQDVERAVLAGEPVPAFQMSVASHAPARTGRVPLRANVAPDVADLWIAVRELFERRGGERQSFVAALSDNVVRYWTPESGEDRPFEAVYRRDRYRCASPTCDRREIGAHHVVFRAHGGSDATDNLVSLCGRCHVDGVHAGHIRVVGRAPGALRWDLGRVVTVSGRCRSPSGEASRPGRLDAPCELG